MSEQAIEQLKKRVVRVVALSFMIVMMFMGGLMYCANLLVNSIEINEVLTYLTTHDGDLPADQVEEFSEILQNEAETQESSADNIPDMVQNAEKVLRELFSTSGSYDTPEFAYSTRYFAVVYPEDAGEEILVKTTHMASVDGRQAVDYANTVRNRRTRFGRLGNYYYRVADREDGSTIVVIMDCTAQISTSRHLLNIALLLIALGMVLSWVSSANSNFIFLIATRQPQRIRARLMRFRQIT